MRIRTFKPKQGDLRVWNSINISQMNHYPVRDPQHAKKLIDALAESQLLDPIVTDNAFGLEIYEMGQWEEWTSNMNETIDEVEFDLTKSAWDIVENNFTPEQ